MIILVTGCRSGIGLQVALKAARAGHTVYAGLRDVDTAGPLSEAAGDLPVTPLALDVTDPHQRDAAVARILAEQGRIDALVNNAGIALGGFLEQIDEDEFRKLIDVNLLAVWAMSRAVLPAMRARGRGMIVNISSMAGRMPMPALGAYAATKFALEGMSEAWRHELRPFGVSVVLVEPGPYKTDIFGRNRTLARRARDPDSPYRTMVERLDAFVERRTSDLARDPAEVAELVVRLLGGSPPALRHPIGPGSRVRDLAVRVVPFSLIEWLVSRVVGRP